MQTTVRNARLEAQELVGGPAAVLEPSPPAVTAEPHRAEDPVAAGDPTAIGPTGTDAEGTSWSSWLLTHPEHREWVADRWLAGARRLPPLPPDLARTRIALHRLATYVMAPARFAEVERFGLRWTLGGFGTPFFGADRQIRVEGTTLVDQRGGDVRSTPITSLRAAAEFLETTIDPAVAAEHDSPSLGDIDEDLAPAHDAATFLGNWFALGFAALESVRADATSLAPSRPQLWPGHFDAAIEIGDDDHRASYGASPGDDAVAEPYLYVSIWWPDRVTLDKSGFWNSTTFAGRVLPLRDFPADEDPVEVAATFWRASRERLG